MTEYQSLQKIVNEQEAQLMEQQQYVSELETTELFRMDKDMFLLSTVDNFFAGKLCELEADFCASNPCVNCGRCINHVDGFTCECGVGFKGQYCEATVDHCESRPCMHGGTCLREFDGFTCVCREGMTLAHGVSQAIMSNFLT